jgi:hypothetical protein
VSGVLRVANASGFYGDRFDAVQEQLEGGPLDVLTGDYLAELTMLILGRARARDPAAGYAVTFLAQLEATLGTAVERGVRIVSNAGGLAPGLLAQRIRELADRLGLQVRVAHVEGDDLLAPDGAGLAAGRAGDGGGDAGPPLTANAYLGGFGIARCLLAGADVVVTGRVTDAALTLGPAIAHFGWTREDLDPLAGAVAAGHVLECGCQATGGNLAGFERLPAGSYDRPLGFPIAELAADGSAVITKHPGTGGAVTEDTVRSQLLYEVTGPRYANPDVTLRLDTVRVRQEGPDRVRVFGARGEPPPPTVKVGLTRLAGFRNEVGFVLTGLDIEAKAELVRRQLEAALAGRRPTVVQWELERTDRADAGTEATASALLRLLVKDSDPGRVGRVVSGAAVELALASYPGFHLTSPPADGSPFGVFTAAYLPQQDVPHRAVLPDGRVEEIPPPRRTRALPPEDGPPAGDGGDRDGASAGSEGTGGGRTVRVPLGTVALARSGDKAGSVNIGIWTRSDEAYGWLATDLTPHRVRQLLPEAAALPVRCHRFPLLRAVNVVIDGLLGEGVAASTRFDPQGKALGEWLRSRWIELPARLVEGEAEAT